MAASPSLSEQDLEAVRAELAVQKPATVWFTPAAVGVPAGGSAKVVAIDDAAEGDFIQVRAAGSRDTMFCSPSELTRVRPPRKRAQAGAAKATAAQPKAAQPKTAQPNAAQPKAVQPEATQPSPARPAPARPSASAAAPVPQERGEPEPPRPRTRRKQAPRPVEVTITLSSTAEGEWTVEVLAGTKRTVRPTSVQPGDVAKAARSLPPAVAEAIESSLQAARQRQLERVERLRSELEAAQRGLQELTGPSSR